MLPGGLFGSGDWAFWLMWFFFFGPFFPLYFSLCHFIYQLQQVVPAVLALPLTSLTKPNRHELRFGCLFSTYYSHW